MPRFLPIAMIAVAVLAPQALGAVSITPGSLSILPTPAPSFEVQAAQVTAFDWDIDRVGDAEVSFSDDADTSEIKLHYLISLRNTEIQALEADCSTPIPSDVTTLSSEMAATSDTHANFTVNVDIKQDSLSNYPSVWTEDGAGEGLISLCVRVDLVLDDAFNTSVTFHEQRVYISVNLLQGIEVTEIDLNRLSATNETGTADLDYNVNACQCDVDGVCESSVLTQGSSLLLCLETTAPSIEIVDVRDLTLIQDAFGSTPIDAGVSDPLTAVTIDGKEARIRHQLVSAYFEKSNPENIVATGSVLLGFTNDNGGRRLVRAPVAVLGSSRRLQNGEEQVESFNVEMAVESAAQSSDSVDACAGGVVPISVLMTVGVLLVA